MKQSELKAKIETLECLIDNYEDEVWNLKQSCAHEYDDGTSAIETYDNSEESWKECPICGKVIYSYEGRNRIKYK